MSFSSGFVYRMKSSEWVGKYKDSGLLKFSSSLAIDSRLKLRLGNCHLTLCLVDILTETARYMLTAPVGPYNQRGGVFPKAPATGILHLTLGHRDRIRPPGSYGFHVSEITTAGAGSSQGGLEKASCCK